MAARHKMTLLAHSPNFDAAMEPTYLFILFLIFCVAAGTQILYLLLFHLRMALYKKRIEAKTSYEPVSVIICARNEDVNLKNNLPAILAQDYPQFEVIVVDDNSEDGTPEYLHYLSQKEPRLKKVKVGDVNRLMAGKKFPLTLGIKAALYDIVVLTDADCKPAGDQWLRLTIDNYRERDAVVLGYGAYEKQLGFLNKLIRFETAFTAMQYFSFALAGMPYMGVGRNLSYKKELFFKYGGFTDHRNIPSGDDDLFINKVANRRNCTINIQKGAFTYSAPKQTYAEWKEQKKRHLSTAKFYKLRHKILLSLYPLTQVLTWILFPVLMAFLFKWYYVLGLFILRWILQRLIFASCFKKLDEKDIIPMIELFDLLQVFYYFAFARAAMVKTKYRWN